VARECWPADCRINLRVVAEPELGLSNARLRGFAEAQYSIICFVDDDNRLDPDWVEIVSRVMAERPEVGACGGHIEADCEVDQPPWLKNFQSYYAVGEQAEHACDVTDTRGYLWGAGLCLRRSAWERLQQEGFDFLLSGRRGSTLTAGEDAELCCALRLNGWRLWYEPQLKMKHFLPAARLQWNYLRRVSRGFGAATASLDYYEYAVRKDGRRTIGRFRRGWSWQTLATVWYLLRKPLKLLRAPFSEMEGDADVIEIENLWGRLIEMLKRGRQYNSERGSSTKSAVNDASESQA